mmetsp:Transcript_123825/g.194227  ORF Transcript_123825/g.194227 Transcript_123825/m.194227 type:complete len:177 (-) Transcript_123825:24-554(-)
MGNSSFETCSPELCREVPYCKSNCSDSCVSPNVLSIPIDDAANAAQFELIRQEVLAKRKKGGSTNLSNKAPFEVVIERTGDQWRNLGVVVYEDDSNQLVVSELLTPSLIAQYNAKNKESRRVRPGDAIVCVNSSMRSSREMIEVIQTCSKGSVIRLWIQPSAPLISAEPCIKSVHS